MGYLARVLHMLDELCYDNDMMSEKVLSRQPHAVFTAVAANVELRWHLLALLLNYEKIINPNRASSRPRGIREEATSISVKG